MLFKKREEIKEEEADGILFFYLSGCPYCKMADTYIAELIEENPAFAAIKIKKVEERQHAAFAKKYDYQYVPCLWIGDKKLHEGVPTKEKIRACLLEAM
ncbi:MAG: thioredoxin family protein [Eubacteriales bacterium]